MRQIKMRLFFCSQFSNTCSYKMDRLNLFFSIETVFRLFIESHKIQKSNVVFGFQFSTPSFNMFRNFNNTCRGTSEKCFYSGDSRGSVLRASSEAISKTLPQIEHFVTFNHMNADQPVDIKKIIIN